MEILNKLKLYRQKEGLSQAKVSKMVGISETHYQNIEYGLTKPNVETAILLAQVLHTTVEDLFPLQNEASSQENNNI